MVLDEREVGALLAMHVLERLTGEELIERAVHAGNARVLDVTYLERTLAQGPERLRGLAHGLAPRQHDEAEHGLDLDREGGVGKPLDQAHGQGAEAIAAFEILTLPAEHPRVDDIPQRGQRRVTVVHALHRRGRHQEPPQAHVAHIRGRVAAGHDADDGGRVAVGELGQMLQGCEAGLVEI